MVFYAFKNVAVYLSLQLILQLTTSYTYGILINNRTLFINSNNNDHYRSLKTIKVSLSNNDSGPNKYIENFLKSSLSKNLFKNQTSDFTANSAELNKLSGRKSWSDIVAEEVLKNRRLEYTEDESAPDIIKDPLYEREYELRTNPYNYRLTPEGRVQLEDHIEYLQRTACSHPVKYKEETPILWIVRSSHGNYCDLLEKDEEKIKSLVNRVRKQFSRSELQILVLKVNVKMPLCEIMLEGTMTDLYYVTPRFWTRCDLLEMDPRLEAKYGKATAPGLFPQWDEDGMMEEIIDCMDVRPDYALEFRFPNAWHVKLLLPKFNQHLMKLFYDNVHWPTRLRVQKAFEMGVEDYRTVIEEEYQELQKLSMDKEGLRDSWFGKHAKFD
uniref:Uncharacterized protein n=1 Tax=Theileria parva TaxID=5875 RepID=Q4N5F5_THEPA|eukprot:XP_764901.1 hypothetical protein [Theileria parva strain Muguga]